MQHPTMQQPDDLPDDLEPGAYFALLYDKKGRKALEAELAAVVEEGDTPRELLEAITAELVAARKPTVAGIVERYAAQCPDGMDLRFCNYMQPPYTDDPRYNELNITAWRRSRGRVIAKWRSDRERWLSLAGVDPMPR